MTSITYMGPEKGSIVKLTGAILNFWLPLLFILSLVHLQINHALMEEIHEINQQLIDTELHVCEDDAESFGATSEGTEGTVIKCTFTAVAVSPSLKSMFASAQMVSFSKHDLWYRLLLFADVPC